MELTYGTIRGILKPLLSLWFDWSIEGAENIPRRGSALLAFNHIAYLDPFAAAMAVDKAKRIPRFLAKSELFQDKRIAWILRGAKQIEVRRGSPEAPMALDHAVRALESGEIVVVFPEGTITNDPDLRPMEAKTGIARLAMATRAPLIPCAIWGTQNVWPKGYAKQWRPRQTILVSVGEPMDLHGKLDSPADWKRVGQEVMEAISVQLAGLRPAVPDRRRPKRSAA
ncbi:MAG TPA: lysophospholipid acyltransferase family protein [Actinomycetota bacterium]|nr:lysophospholipid acyltransferase family protein [Actinomycetota bacterium]